MKNNAKIDINKESLNSVTKSEIITVGKVVQLKFKNQTNVETSKIKNMMQQFENEYIAQVEQSLSPKLESSN